jgi:type IV pilus assembly protein PilY1
MKNLFITITLILMNAQYVYATYPTTGTAQDGYCQVPPYVTQNVKPNINLILDFSGSMQFPAYLDCSSWVGYDSSKVANCGTHTLGATYQYSKDRNYYGNFKNDVYYKYNSTGKYFEENAACTNVDRIGSITSNCLSGSLLNWAVTTRTDVLRKILTGGRVKASTTDVLESEGSRYVVSDLSLGCKFTVTASSTTSRKLTVENETGYICSIGTFSDNNVDVKTTNPTDDIKGVVNSIYPGLVDLELSVYNTTVGRVYRVGKNKTLSDYLNAINAELAYNGTPTGEALREAEYYFQQSTNLTGTNEAIVLGKANYLYDPYYELGNLAAPCRKSFVLLISDGVWNGSVDPVNPAYDMRKNDMRTDTALSDKQNVTTYAVYAFGDGAQGRQAMVTTAVFGGFDDDDNNGWPYPFAALPTSSLDVTYPRPNCDPAGTWNTQCSEWDTEKKGLPYNFFEANDGAALKTAITKAVNDILGRVTSGAAASVLGNNDSNGATLLQALYFPERRFGNDTKASWTGELQALWYYVDPLLRSSRINIREDTVEDKNLRLSQDKIATFVFNDTGTKSKVNVNLYNDSNGDGAADSTTLDTQVSTDNLDGPHVKALWRAGLSLWSRLPYGTGGRTVYTNDPSCTALMIFGTDNRDLLKPYLDVASNNTDAENVINFALGANLNKAGYRNRTVTVNGSDNVWKLGDIINSTPKMLSGSKLNTYDNQPPGGYLDKSYGMFVSSNNYKNRGVAFVGANDGMLHAFKMGKIFDGSAGYISEIKNADKSEAKDLGTELWGYVPRNVLPYLKHLGNPSYKHLFYIDSTPTLIDASIGQTKSESITCDAGITGSTPYYTCPKTTTLDSGKNLSYDISGSLTGGDSIVGTSWRTVLIGSMGWGGATRDYAAACTDCVKTPISGTGYSSYFALDVTYPESPQLLWEFSHPRLGFSSVRPAVVRVKDPTDTGNPQRNGRWFVVLASGPTGPIDAGSNQMKAYSDQPLTIFILDLKTGTLLRTFSTDSLSGVGHTQVPGMPVNAFGGTFSDATIDADKGDLTRPGNYSDDAVYLGYVRKDTTTGSSSLDKFTKGGVLRILTGEDHDPANWKISTVIDGIGPVTSAVAKLQDKYHGILWLYFGTGRYFYKIGAAIDEDYSGQQESIYGIKEPCYSAAANDLNKVDCKDSVLATSLVNQTKSITPVGSAPGWKIDLAQAGSGFNAKRIITNPVPSASGTLFFTAFQPSTDVCGYGGQTSLWALKYDTGGVNPGLIGQALIQLSTGASRQVDLSKDFNQSLGRETTSSKGVTSRDDPPIFSNANHFPSRRILHIQER